VCPLEVSGPLLGEQSLRRLQHMQNVRPGRGREEALPIAVEGLYRLAAAARAGHGA